MLVLSRVCIRQHATAHRQRSALLSQQRLLFPPTAMLTRQPLSLPLPPSPSPSLFLPSPLSLPAAFLSFSILTLVPPLPSPSSGTAGQKKGGDERELREGEGKDGNASPLSRRQADKGKAVGASEKGQGAGKKMVPKLAVGPKSPKEGGREGARKPRVSARSMAGDAQEGGSASNRAPGRQAPRARGHPAAGGGAAGEGGGGGENFVGRVSPLYQEVEIEDGVGAGDGVGAAEVSEADRERSKRLAAIQARAAAPPAAAEADKGDARGEAAEDWSFAYGQRASPEGGKAGPDAKAAVGGGGRGAKVGEGQYDKTLSPPDKRRGGRGRRAGGASSGAPTPRSGGPTPRSSIAASSPRSKARVPSLPTSQNSSPRRRGGAGAGQVAAGVAVAAAVGVVAGVEAAGEDVEEEYDEDFDEMDESTVASGPQVFHPKTVLLAPCIIKSAP